MTVNEDMEIIYDPALSEVLPERVYRNLIEEYTEVKTNDGNRPGDDYLQYHNTRFSKITGIKI